MLTKAERDKIRQKLERAEYLLPGVALNAQSMDLRALLDSHDEADAELAEYKALFDLCHEADMRGVKLWRDASPGSDLVLPDQAHLVKFLIDRITSALGILRDCMSRDNVSAYTIEPAVEILKGKHETPN